MSHYAQWKSTPIIKAAHEDMFWIKLLGSSSPALLQKSAFQCGYAFVLHGVQEQYDFVPQQFVCVRSVYNESVHY